MVAYQFKRPLRKRRSAVNSREVTAILFAAIFGVFGCYLLITTHAATALQPSVAWTNAGGELQNNNADLCLGTPGSTTPAIGTAIVIEGCSAVSGEKWTLTWSTTVKSTTIVNGYGQCLDDRGGNAGVGSSVKIYTCTANDTAQSWTTGYGDGTIRIDGLCLGVSGNSRAAGSDAILTPCNTPVPSVQITSPTSGSTVSGTVTVSASASISQDSIAKITIQVGGSVLNTCMNASSCSASWNTAAASNGSYAVTAVATGALGGTATATETVKVSNASSSGGASSGSGGSSSSGGSSGNSGSGGSISTGGGSDSSGSTSTDTTITNQGTYTCDPSDPTCSDSTISVCDPSDPTCSDDTSLCDPSDPTCNDSTPSDSSDGTDSGTGSTDNSSSGSSQSSSGSTAKKASSNGTSSKAVIGITLSLLALVVAGCIVFLRVRRRNQISSQPAFDADAFFAQIAPPAADQPAIPSSEITPPHEHLATNASLPTENSAETAARLQWWDASAGHQPAQSAPSPTHAEEPPDMFEEGRRRLDQEEQDGRFH